MKTKCLLYIVREVARGVLFMMRSDDDRIRTAAYVIVCEVVRSRVNGRAVYTSDNQTRSWTVYPDWSVRENAVVR